MGVVQGVSLRMWFGPGAGWQFPCLNATKSLTKSDPQVHHGGSAATLVLRRLGYRLHVRMLLQGLTGLCGDAHAAAVDYADSGQSGQEGAVDEILDFAGGVVDGVADDVEFRRDGVAFVGDGDGDAAGARGLHRRIGGAWAGENLAILRARSSFSSRPFRPQSDRYLAGGRCEPSGLSISAGRYRPGRLALPASAGRAGLLRPPRWSGQPRRSRTAREIRGAAWPCGVRHPSRLSARRRGPGLHSRLRGHGSRSRGEGRELLFQFADFILLRGLSFGRQTLFSLFSSRWVSCRVKRWLAASRSSA